MSMKKCLVFGVFILLIASVFGTAIGIGVSVDGMESEVGTTYFSGGEGTEDDPYLIENVHDLQNISEDVTAHYELADDIDASETEDWNDGKGFEPIGFDEREFTGSLDGNGYNITDLYIDRSDTDYIGMFGFIGSEGSISDLGLVDSEVNGEETIGALAAWNAGTVDNSFNTGDVSGSEEEGSWEFTESEQVGGLIGVNTGTVEKSYTSGEVSTGGHVGGLIGYNTGTVKNSYATGNIITTSYFGVGGLVGQNYGTVETSNATGDVKGDGRVGGFIGANSGTVSNSHATGYVKGGRRVGGLVGANSYLIKNSYATGDVWGHSLVGGLIGDASGSLDNSYYNVNEVQINGGHHLTIGGLYEEQYQDWKEDMELDIDDYNETLQPLEECYEIEDVEGFRYLLGFADNEEYKFCLDDDIDLSEYPGLYIPYLAADFDGNGYNITNLSVDQPFGAQVGMFGHNDHGSIKNIGLLDINVRGERYVGGIVGRNVGSITDSYITGTIWGYGAIIGALVGSSSGSIENSHYNVNEVQINGGHHLMIGGLYEKQYQDWIEDMELDIDDYNETLQPSEECYEIKDVEGVQNLLGFAHNEEYKFCLGDDIDFSEEPGLYIPYLAADFDGKGYNISNLALDQSFGSYVGMFGQNAGGTVKNLTIVDAEVNGGGWYIGTIVGSNNGIIKDSYATGVVSGGGRAGGLIGLNRKRVEGSHFSGDVNGGGRVGGLVGTGRRVSNSYATGNVSGQSEVGGLIGMGGEVISSYSTADVTGNERIGGLIGRTEASITKSYATGNVAGEKDVGGLIGWNKGEPDNISNTYSTGNVDGVENVGGLIGRRTSGSVTNSYATGDVTGENNIGGLIGLIEGLGEMEVDGDTVFSSYATGNVEGVENLGGLIGSNIGGSITNSYATGNVGEQDESKTVGGLIGLNEDVVGRGGLVINSYSTGHVAGNEDLGGLIGINDGGDVSDSFWDTESSGIEESDGGTGKTTAEMKDVATYTDETTEGLEEPWDFVCNPNDDEGDEDIWNIDAYEEVNKGYPFLDWQDVELDKFELNVDSTEGGEVILPGEDTFEYEQWSEVDLEAVAEEGYRFVEWTGDTDTIEDTMSETTTIKMEDHHSITAHFEELDEYDLTINIEGEGSTDPEEGTHTYYDGEEVTVEAIPAEGWYFDQWTGDYEGTDEEITVTMDEDKSLTAWFEIYEYELDISIEGEGSVDIDPEQEVYEHGTEVELTAIPDEGWYFEEWTGDHESEDEEITVMMDDDKSVTAHFEVEEYTLTVNTDGEGSVEIEPEKAEYEHGEEVTLTAVPDSGWEFEEWTGDVPEEEEGEEITITMDDDKEITAVFEEEDEIPGFTSTLLLLAIIIAVAIYKKKKR